jgi:hypothetical protein
VSLREGGGGGWGVAPEEAPATLEAAAVSLREGGGGGWWVAPEEAPATLEEEAVSLREGGGWGVAPEEAPATLEEAAVSLREGGGGGGGWHLRKHQPRWRRRRRCHRGCAELEAPARSCCAGAASRLRAPAPHPQSRPTLRTAGSLQSVPPSCRGRRVAVCVSAARACSCASVVAAWKAGSGVNPSSSASTSAATKRCESTAAVSVAFKFIN